MIHILKIVRIIIVISLIASAIALFETGATIFRSLMFFFTSSYLLTLGIEAFKEKKISYGIFSVLFFVMTLVVLIFQNL